MEDQSLSLSIPNEWREHFIIKRIDEKNIHVTLEERNSILEALTSGARFIQIGKYTIMINSIKSIDPFYEPDNIPPKPEEEWEATFDAQGDTASRNILNKDKIDLWEKLFGNKLVVSNEQTSY